jgi:hypothetical protein
MDLCLATLKPVSFYLLHNVSKLNKFRKFSCVTVVCKHFASYQYYPNYKWDLTFILLMCTFGRASNNASKWEMGFDSVA